MLRPANLLQAGTPFHGTAIEAKALKAAAANLPSDVPVTMDFEGPVIGKVVEAVVKDGAILVDVEIQDPGAVKKIVDDICQGTMFVTMSSKVRISVGPAGA